MIARRVCIARIGDSTCAGQISTAQSRRLVIVDARIGCNLSALPLDLPIIMNVAHVAMQQDPQALAEVTISKSQPLWSPDGRSIAVSYFAFRARSSSHEEEPVFA